VTGASAVVVLVAGDCHQCWYCPGGPYIPLVHSRGSRGRDRTLV